MNEPVLIQPVESPVICKPYYEPAQYWEYERNTGRAQKMEGRREASYWYKDQSGDIRPAAYAIDFTLKYWVNAGKTGGGSWRGAIF